MTRSIGFPCCAFVCLVISSVAQAQHCAPIYESYLSEISVKNTKDKLKIRCEYTIRGGAGQDCFQAYILAYLERDAARVPSRSREDLIDHDAAVVLKSQLIRRNGEGAFPFEIQIDGDELAKKMITHGRLTEKDRTENGGWGSYNDRVRIAIFVPFLEDTKYSILDGLPANRHCCNYLNDRALLFQTLPYQLSIHFGIVRAVPIEPGKFQIEVNGDKPPRIDK